MEVDNPLDVEELIENVMFYLLDAGPAMLNLACVSKMHHRVVHSTSAWLRFGFSCKSLSNTSNMTNDDDYVAGKAIANILATRRIIQLRKELELIEGSFKFAENMDCEDLYPSLNRETATALVKVCNYAYDIVTVPELVDVIRMTKTELMKAPVRSPLRRLIKMKVELNFDNSNDYFTNVMASCHVKRNSKHGYLYEFEFSEPSDWYFQALIYKNFARNQTKSISFINTNIEYNGDQPPYGIHRKLYFFIYNHVTDVIELCGDFEDYMTQNEIDDNEAVEKLDELLHENDTSGASEENMSEDGDESIFDYIQISHFDDAYEGSVVHGKDSPLVLENLKLLK